MLQDYRQRGCGRRPDMGFSFLSWATSCTLVVALSVSFCFSSRRLLVISWGMGPAFGVASGRQSTYHPYMLRTYIVNCYG